MEGSREGSVTWHAVRTGIDTDITAGGGSDVPEIEGRETGEATLSYQAQVHQVQADLLEVDELAPNSKGV